MALNVDKNRQLAGYTDTPTAQPRAGETATSSQASVFTSNSTSNNGVYIVKQGDISLWKFTKEQLIAHGNKNPSSVDIYNTMLQIAKANGCSSTEECNKKFATIGNQINIEGIFEKPQPEPSVKEAPTEPDTPILSEQETKIKDELKSKFPDLNLQNMTDAEVKAFLDKLKDTNPEIYSTLETQAASNTEQTEASAPADNTTKNEKTKTTGLTEEQTTALKEQLNQYISEHPEVTTERQSAPMTIQSEIEQLAQKIGAEGNIDEIIANLKTKQKAGETLSEDEAKLLNLYSTQASNKFLVSQIYGFFNSDKTLDEQMNYIVDGYLSRHEDPTLLALQTEEERIAYIDKVAAEIKEMAVGKDTGNEKIDDSMTILRVSMLLKIAETKHLSIEQLKAMPDVNRQKMIDVEEAELLKKAILEVSTHINTDELKNKQYAERINIYADAILQIFDTEGEYAKMSDAEKAQHRDAAIVKFAQKYLGIDQAEALLSNPMTKESIYATTAINIERIIEASKSGDNTDGVLMARNITFKAINNTSYDNAADLVEYFQEKGNTLTEQEKEAYLDARCEAAILKRVKLEKGEKYATSQQAVDAMEELLNDSNNGLSHEEKERIQTWLEEQKTYIKICEETGIKAMYNSHIGTAAKHMAKTKEGEFDPVKVAQEIFGGNDPNYDYSDLDTNDRLKGDEAKFKEFAEFVKGLTPEQRKQLQIGMEKAGVSKEKFYEYMTNVNKYLLENKEQPIDLSAYQYSESHTAEDIKNSVDMAVSTGAKSRGCIAKHVANRKDLGKDTQSEILAKTAIDKVARGGYIDGLKMGEWSKEDQADIISRANNSGNMSNSIAAIFNKEFVDAQTSDELKLFFGQNLSQNTNNAAALEGLGAASGSISNANIRNQYNSFVTNAAQSLPPSSQSAINTAIKTGKISNTTLSQTTPPASSSSNTHSSSGNNSNPRTSGSSNSHSTTQTQSQTQNYSQPQQTTYNYNYNTPTTNTYTNPQTSTTSSVQKSSLASPSLSQADVARVAASNEAKRQQAMEHAKETAQTIDEAVEDWNKKHAKKLSVEDIDTVKAAAAVEAAREAVESSATSESEKERILTALYNATSIGEVYNILVEALGVTRVQDKFIEILASSGSTSNIKAFVASRAGDSDSLVKQLFLRTSSTSLKKELLGMLSSDTVAELLANKQITDLTSVDQRILINYVMKNIHLMSNTEFAKFLNAIADPVEKNKLIEIRTGVSQMRSRKPKTDAVQAKSETSEIETTTTSEAPTVQPAPQAFSFMQQGQQAPIAEAPARSEHPDEPAPTAPSKLGSGELSRDLGDGTILTREGAGFGAISNTDFDLTRVVQKPKHKDGAPIGMEDETLTVGSAEWNKKYNKNNVQTTAFTLASLEEEFGDEDFGGIWGGTSGNFKGKKPDKKLHRGLKFNA